MNTSPTHYTMHIFSASEEHLYKASEMDIFNELIADAGACEHHRNLILNMDKVFQLLILLLIWKLLRLKHKNK
jgi:hypothetical protein